MNLLLFLFAIPFAIIIFSIILQKLIHSPTLVALAVFSIFIILAITVFDETFFILAVIYAILAYITAVLTRIVKSFISRCVNNQQACSCSIVDNVNSQDEISLSEGQHNNGYCERNDMVIDKRNVNRKCWR